MGPIVSEQYQYVIGVDTHAATHTFAVLAAPSGAVIDHDTFPTTTSGLGRALSWIARRVGQASVLVVVEGTGSYGAILTERLELAGHRVVEAAVMPAGDRRGVGKSDTLDAARIARAVLGLSENELRTPRTLSVGEDVSSGARVALRVLVVARDQMTGERTRAINTLTALLRTVDLGVDARKPLTAAQLTTIAGWRDREENMARRTCRAEAVRLARRIRTLGVDLATNKRGINDLIADTRTRATDAARDRARRRSRCPHRLVPPGKSPLRSRDGLPRRHMPHPRLLGQHRPVPTQPRR